MFSAGDTCLQDSLIGLALVRGRLGSGNDAAVMRGSIAFMLWLPGLLLLLMMSTALDSGLVVLVGVPLLLLVLWRFVARSPRKT
jgi:ABC-type dipeptide/oligopeptide/nickel transport system permease subunit